MKWGHAAIYLAVTLAIAGPLLAPGYVFALDHAMGPRVAAYYARYIGANDDAIQNKGAYAILLVVLTTVLPAWVAQKLILFGPFLVAGIGAHLLAERRVRPTLALFAGLVYMLSPFAYIRGVAGQTGVLWAYALAPLFLVAWLRAVDGSRRGLAAAALLAFATGVFQAHGLVLLGILVALLALVRLARQPSQWRAHLGRPAMLGAALLLLNAAWIVPVMLAPQTTLDRIGVADRSYFQTTSSGMPSVGVAALTLQGFWRSGYESAFAGHLWLLVVPAAILVLSVHGLRARRDDLSVALAVAGVGAFALAVGSASPLTAPLWDAAWDYVPLIKGFRDSQKLLALLALAYADLASAGAEDLVARIRLPRLTRTLPAIAVALLLALPLATAAPMLRGYDGQLGVASYPDAWREAEDVTHGCSGSMVALPWHLYMDASWIPNDGKRVTNPAKLYFSCPLVSSDDVEAGGSAGKAGSPTGDYVAFWLHDMGMDGANPHRISTFGNILSAVDVQYLLVLKESDWRAQSRVLAAQDDLRLVLDNARVQVWENQAAIAPVWSTDVVVPIASWKDIAPLSERRPLGGVILAPVGTMPEEGRRVAGISSSHYLLLTPDPSQRATGWTLGGKDPRWISLGVAPVFDQEGSAMPSRAGEALLQGALWAVSFLSLVGVSVASAPWRSWRNGASPQVSR